MRLRVYTNPDVVGCEVAGVVKNVIAIASGMAEGMGFGDNTRATLITRGLAEMTRLGVALGGQPLTFAGPGRAWATSSPPAPPARAATAPSASSSAAGRSIDEIIAEMNMVAEGVKSSPVGARRWRGRTTWRCRSPSRWSRCATTGGPRATPCSR